MQLEVLVATVDQTDLRLLSSMNIRSDVRITNQADDCSLLVSEHPWGRAEMLTLPDRGVGLNRNLGLMRSSADLCLFADDDVRYADDYASLVTRAFAERPEADVLLFNVLPDGSERSRRVIVTEQLLNRWTAPAYSATFRIAVRRESVLRENVTFSLLFGGGARYSSGEDVLFVTDCIKRGLRVVAVPVTIGTVSDQSSTWFTGFGAKYFQDKGVFFAHLSPRLAPLLALAFAIKHRTLARDGVSWLGSLRLMLAGIRRSGK